LGLVFLIRAIRKPGGLWGMAGALAFRSDAATPAPASAGSREDAVSRARRVWQSVVVVDRSVFAPARA
jgi:hypothetical protein